MCLIVAPKTLLHYAHTLSSCKSHTQNYLSCPGTLRFYVNGKNQGIAYTNLPRGVEMYGAVSMFSTGVNFAVQYEDEFVLHIEEWNKSRFLNGKFVKQGYQY